MGERALPKIRKVEQRAVGHLANFSDGLNAGAE
jgi:hypothetical protein